MSPASCNPSKTAALVCSSLDEQASAKAAEVDRSITARTPPAVRQIDVLFDSANYTAFPHVVRLDGDELFMAFRQAPSQERVRHTHPRSVITVIRSYNLGETWDIDNGGQLAAGGGQEFAPIYLGDGVVGGLLAMHEVVPVRESPRTAIPHIHKHEYPFRNVGGVPGHGKLQVAGRRLAGGRRSPIKPAPSRKENLNDDGLVVEDAPGRSKKRAKRSYSVVAVARS